jgi:peptidoglycan DL-endopeptidase CwlO
MSYGSRPAGGSRVSAGGFLATAVAAGLLAAYLTGHHPAAGTTGGGTGASLTSQQGQNAAAAADVTKAVAYARHQLGKPYLWGGNGPDAFDCSGLVMMAYRQSGIRFGSARPTAAVEWAFGRQVSTPEPGDLVFFAGVDGTDSAPGHVGIVTDPARHLMIDAYAAGIPVRYDTYGLPSSAEGLSDPVGFTDPTATIRGP